MKVLLAVTGLSPQVITETIYALAINHDWVPDEIIVITTEVGRQAIRDKLLTENSPLEQLATDYCLPKISLEEQNIIVFIGSDNQPLADIDTEAQNILAADQILSKVRSITSDEETELHVSIAGGRKTMSYFAGMALTLFGRTQDRISHVLVEAPYEKIADFYYTTPYNKPLQFNGTSYNAADAKIQLANIPYLRLRDHQQQDLHDGHLFKDIIEATQHDLDKNRITVLPYHQQIKVGEISKCVKSADFIYWFTLLQRWLKNPKPFEAPMDEHDQIALRDEYLNNYKQYCGTAGHYERINATRDTPVDRDEFRSKVSKVNRDLRKQFGSVTAEKIRIVVTSSRPKQYFFNFKPQQLEITSGTFPT